MKFVQPWKKFILISNSNILIYKSKHIRISNFGTAKLFDNDDNNDNGIESMTSGVGTLRFMSPELLREIAHYSEKVDACSFKCCCILHPI